MMCPALISSGPAFAMPCGRHALALTLLCAVELQPAMLSSEVTLSALNLPCPDVIQILPFSTLPGYSLEIVLI